MADENNLLNREAKELTHEEGSALQAEITGEERTKWRWNFLSVKWN